MQAIFPQVVGHNRPVLKDVPKKGVKENSSTARAIREATIPGRERHVSDHLRHRRSDHFGVAGVG